VVFLKPKRSPGFGSWSNDLCMFMFKFQSILVWSPEILCKYVLGRSSFHFFWVSITVTAIYCPQEFKTSLLADWHCIHWVNSSVFTMD
jgi:hypothetical protein